MDYENPKAPKHVRNLVVGILISIGAIVGVNFLIDFIKHLNDPNPNGALAFLFFSLFGLGVFLIIAFFLSIPIIIIWQINANRPKNQTPKPTPKPIPRTEEDDDRDW